MRLQGGLKPEDWHHWGQFTTFKTNAAELLRGELRPNQRIYCSPLTDPYQPAEEQARLMPAILDAVSQQPPRAFVLQTRGPLILRDLDRLRDIPGVRVSFSITTNREDIRKLYEPHCAPIAERLTTVRALREAGVETYVTVAPLLPCDPEELAAAVIDASGRDLIGDPLHVRAVKPRGATTRDAAFRISRVRGHSAWLDPAYQASMVERIRAAAAALGHSFTTGPEGFSILALGKTAQ